MCTHLFNFFIAALPFCIKIAIFQNTYCQFRQTVLYLLFVSGFNPCFI